MDNTLFSQALGLTAPWQVSNVDFRQAEAAIHFQVICDAQRLPCPACRAADQPIHDRIARTWQHQLSEGTTVWKDLDGWLRRRLRCLLWRQAKTRQRRTAMLRKRGLPEARAWHSGHNGQGPWWNSGASHMNHAFPKAFFDRLRLVSILDTSRNLQRHS